MKNIKLSTKIITAVLILSCSSALLTSCKKYLDVKSDALISPDAAFGSLNNTQLALTGVYSKLPGDSAYGTRLSIYFPQWGDDFKSSVTGGNTNLDHDRREISSFGTTPTNAPLLWVFNSLFTGVERANICIKYIPKSPLYNVEGSTGTTMHKLYGEALTLRAIFAMELVRNWGDVPFSFVPSEDVTNLCIPNVNRDVIYDHILDDLKTAEDIVPWRTESGDPVTRISKAFVKALRARIALARGGYSLRSDSHIMERNSDYKDYYKIAYDECKDLMTHREQSTLNPNYEAVFKSLHPLYYSADDASHEMIFAIGAGAASGTNSRTDTKLGYGNGLNTDQSSAYGKASSYNAAIPTYFYEFDSIADCRRDVTISIYSLNSSTQKALLSATKWTEAKFRRCWASSSNAYAGASGNYLDIRWPVMRFADVLLMYAEADNELNGAPSGDAQAALKEVRSRAYANHLDAMPAIPTDYNGFFNAIVKERLLEFGGEGIRKYDLIRWNLLASKISETKAKLRDFADTSAANSGSRYANLPTNIYFTPSAFSNASIANEMNSLSLYGGTGAYVLFNPATTTSTPVGGWQKVAWRADVVPATYIDDPTFGYAYYFKANLKELLPFPQTAIENNYNLVQNPY